MRTPEVASTAASYAACEGVLIGKLARPNKNVAANRPAHASKIGASRRFDVVPKLGRRHWFAVLCKGAAGKLY